MIMNKGKWKSVGEWRRNGNRKQSIASHGGAGALLPWPGLSELLEGKALPRAAGCAAEAGRQP